MDAKTYTMTRAMAEPSRVSGTLDTSTGGPVHLATQRAWPDTFDSQKLRAKHCLIDLALRRAGSSGENRPSHVAMISPETGSNVKYDEFPSTDHAIRSPA